MERALKKVLLYYCISLIIGCISALLYLKTAYLGAVILTASFLVSIIIIDNKKYSPLIISFYIIGILAYINYYNIQIMNERICVRIVKNLENSSIAQYKNRNILIYGELKNCKEGNKIYIEGEFQKEEDYARGTVGVYKVIKSYNAGSDVISKLYELKREVYNRYKERLGDKYAGIVVATCFGDTSYISEVDKQDFNKLGILHVVSVSGLHLALVYKLLEGIIGLQGALILAFIYVIFTGGASATMRAFIMIIILKLSKKIFKKYDALSALAFSAMLLILWKPYYISDMGFILSYLSMLGIFLTYNKTKHRLKFLPVKLNETISLSISAQTFSAPYIIATMNSFSLGFIFGNVFLLPLYSGVVIIGNLALLVYKFDFIFNIFCTIIKVIMLAIDGGSEILKACAPPISYMNYNMSVYIVLIYISYMIYKSGKKYYKYLPLIILPLLVMDNYKFFPQIEYIKSSNMSYIAINYRANKILITDKYNISNIKKRNIIEKLSINNTIINEESVFRLTMNNICKMSIYKQENTQRYKNIVFQTNKQNLVITANEASALVDFKNYDIIYLDSKKREEKITLLIIFDRVYVLS
jgi:competence protein ComEC